MYSHIININAWESKEELGKTEDKDQWASGDEPILYENNT